LSGLEHIYSLETETALISIIHLMNLTTM